MIECQPPYKQAAFTLIELIIVIIILGVLSIYIQSFFSTSSSYREDEVVEQIISSARLTQQLAMNDSTRNFSLVIASNQINLLVDGATFSQTGLTYPLQLGDQVTITPQATVMFDSLGRTPALTLNVLVEIGTQVCFESSGFVHRC